MKVTPTTKKFGKYQPGQEFEFPDKAARIFIGLGKLREVQGYQTRMMSADAASAINTHLVSDAAVSANPAPYGYKSDGTPRKRPGRPAVNA
jgi:hypothetical protein